MKRVLGLGNALTDILLQVSEGDLREIGFPKGSMNLINAQQFEQLQARFASVRKRLVAGGSASNTVATIAQLGGKAAFIGKIGCDEVGKFYRDDLIKNNVQPILLSSSLISFSAALSSTKFRLDTAVTIRSSPFFAFSINSAEKLRGLL